MDTLQKNFDGPESGETSFEDILPFPIIGEKTKQKSTKAINTGTDYLQAKNIKMSIP